MEQTAPKRFATLAKFERIDALKLDRAEFAAAAFKTLPDGYLIHSQHPKHGELHAKLMKPTNAPASWFHKKWEQFHTWTIRGSLVNPWKFLNPFFADLPDGECQCRTHAIEYSKASPPPMDRTERIRWGYDFHCDANAHAGSPVCSRAEFVKLYDLPASILEEWPLLA